jgi:hypothetical protein
LAELVNGDISNDSIIHIGSGGSGGPSSSAQSYGGAGGGGAGGGAIYLIAEDGLVIDGYVGTQGASGGHGGMAETGAGGDGGGGSGGGILLRGSDIHVTGNIDARGRVQDNLSEANGGTIKVSYVDGFNNEGNLTAGRIVINRLPVMSGLSTPIDMTWILPKPVFTWRSATDPEDGFVSYELEVSRTIHFAPGEIEFNTSGVSNTNWTVPFGLPEGQYFWRVRASDSFGPGPWSEVWSFRVDGTPPVSHVGQLPEYSRSANFTVGWSGTDSLSGISNYTIFVSDNGANYTSWIGDTNETGAVFSGTEGHTYRFYSIATDIAGNREAAHATPDAATTVDSLAPFSMVNPLAPFRSSPDFEVGWSASDATSGVSYIDIYASVDNGTFSVWKDNMTLDVPSATYHGAEGHEYSFYSIARDFAGNVQAAPGPELIQTTRVDGTKPATLFEPGAPSYGTGPVYITPDTTLSLNATDNYSGVNRTLIIIDSKNTMEYSGGFHENQPGSHNITYWSVDEAGNIEAQRTAWFFVDDKAPATELAFVGANFTAGGSVFVGAGTQLVLNGLDVGSGLNRTIYQIDGTGWRQYDGPFNISSGGNHTVQYRSMDNLGQQETVRNVLLTVDVSPPQTNAAPDSNISNKDIHIAFIANDSGSGVAGIYFRVVKSGTAGSVFSTGNSTSVVASADHGRDGLYLVEYYSVDNVGNAEPIQTLMVTIDTVANLTVNGKTGWTVGTDAVTLNGRAEPGSTVRANGKDVAVLPDGSFSARISLKEGKNKVVVNATDPAGNTVEKTVYVTYTKPFPSDWILPAVILGIVVAVVAVAYIGIRKGRNRPLDSGEEE